MNFKLLLQIMRRFLYKLECNHNFGKLIKIKVLFKRKICCKKYLISLEFNEILNSSKKKKIGSP